MYESRIGASVRLKMAIRKVVMPQSKEKKPIDGTELVERIENAMHVVPAATSCGTCRCFIVSMQTSVGVVVAFSRTSRLCRLSKWSM